MEPFSSFPVSKGESEITSNDKRRPLLTRQDFFPSTQNCLPEDHRNNLSKQVPCGGPAQVLIPLRFLLLRPSSMSISRAILPLGVLAMGSKFAKNVKNVNIWGLVCQKCQYILLASCPSTLQALVFCATNTPHQYYYDHEVVPLPARDSLKKAL